MKLYKIFLVCLVFLILTLVFFSPVLNIPRSSFLAQVAPTNGLVGHYTFDEGSGSIASDYSGNGNSGTLINGPTWTTGKLGGAIAFDGADDYVNGGTGSTLRPSLPLSFSYWVKVNSLSKINGILSYREELAHNGYFTSIGIGGSVNISYGSNNNCASQSRRTKTSNTSVVGVGQWHHVVGVIRGPTDMDIYVNGVDVGGTYSGTGGALTYGANSFLRLGGLGGGQESCAGPITLNGSLDDVRIYNRALLASEISDIYNSTGKTSTTGSTQTQDIPPATVSVPIISSFSASPSSIISGNSTTLSWSVSGATSLSINQGVGAVTGTSKSVAPSVTTTYTLTATNASGSVTSTVTVAVNAAVVMPADPISTTAPSSMQIEWRLLDGVYMPLPATGGTFGSTGVALETRGTPTVNGTRYDVRIKNRTTGSFDQSGLRIRIPRSGASTKATIEGMEVNLPAEIYQGWKVGTLAGSKYGFYYEIKSNGTIIQTQGPSATVGVWGARGTGIVRIDGKAYVIPEFWERQPRKITVTATEIILTLFEGNEYFKAGEDLWDRFAIIDNASVSDTAILDQVDALPNLTEAERKALMAKYEIAPEGLSGVDAEAEALLRYYDKWQGTSWEAKYADCNPARVRAGFSCKTTLFEYFERGHYHVASKPGIYTWKAYGDIEWAGSGAGGYSSLHYDWVRAAFRHYLRTGNKDALKWGMAAVRHAVSTDYTWKERSRPGDTGLSRYEKGHHRADPDYPPTQSHTWGEGLFLASDMTGDSWIKQAALQRVEGAYNNYYIFGDKPVKWDGTGGARALTWPMVILLRGFEETGNIKYWNKSKEIMASIMAKERTGKGYLYQNLTAEEILAKQYEPTNLVINAYYASYAYTKFADIAIKRGEWTPAHQGFIERMATWLSTPMPNGPYYPSLTGGAGGFAFDWCPPDISCVYSPDLTKQVNSNIIFRDFFAWMAKLDQNKWSKMGRLVFNDSVKYGDHPGGIVGYLTNQYPATESKILGRTQLFGDRAALWLANGQTSPAPSPVSPEISPPTIPTLPPPSISNTTTPTPPTPTGGVSGGSVSPGSTGSSGTSPAVNTPTQTCLPETQIYSLVHNLAFGSKSDDVTRLQKFLVQNGYMTADNATGFFGQVTESAIKSFQRNNNIVFSGDPVSTGYGAAGPATRAIINKLIFDSTGCGSAGVSGTPTTQTTIPPYAPSVSSPRPQTKAVLLGRNIALGARGDDVKILQNFLVGRGYLTADNVTGYFGYFTQSAVQNLQRALNIVSSGTPDSTGYGAVGPMTKKRINDLII